MPHGQPAFCVQCNVATAQQARKRFLGLAEEYVRFSMTHYGLWRLMFGPHGVATSTEPVGRPATYAWLQRALDELHRTGVLPKPASPADQFFAWSAIHGLADLQASPVIRTAPLTESVERQVMLILRALGTSPS